MRNRSGGEMSSASASVRVEKATSDLLIGPDWTMNMDICDSINNDHWQAKDVVKALKKRLQHKNPKVQFLALTLLETMIKNCGDNVHFQVVDRDILQEMVKIVRKKTDMQVRDKILVLLDSWQEAFGGPGGKYPQYYLAYTDLKRSGVEFPKRSPDSALIFTPPVQHPGQLPRHLQLGYGMPSNSSLRLEEAMASEMANLSLSDLDRYRSVMELLGDMLKAVNPGDREAIKDELIVDLVSQCRSNQKKLMEMVNSTGDEELLGQCLALNDDLQSLLAKHDSIASGASLPAEASESTPEPNTPVALAPVVANRSEDEEEDDDDFAQLARRNSKYQANQAAAEANQQVPSPNHSDETNATSGSTSEASSSVASNALALPDPPAPVKTSTKEQDMIDLLSITLSSNLSPPRTPLTPPSVPLQSQSLSPVSSNGPGSPYNSQQPYMTNQGYVPYNSYVAPWAQQQSQPHPQPQPQQQAPQFLSSYPSQPQPQPQHQFPSSYSSQPQPQPQHQPQPQQQVSQSSYPSQPQPQPQPQPQQQMLQGQSSYLSHAHPQYRSQQQVPSNYPPPPWESTSSANPNPFSTSTYPYTTPAANTSTYMPRPQPQYASNVPVASTTEAQVNPNLTRQTGYGASPKPYIPANKLFEDLIDLKAADRGGKTSSTSQTLSGSPHQGMIGGRK